MAITPRTTEHDWRVERLVFFSDAVFAIAITLLALELKLPETVNTAANTDLLKALGDHSSQFLGFAISFAVIASFWVQHVHLFRKLNRHSQPFVWLNILMLFLIVCMPFTTSLISGETTGVGVIIYAANVMLTSIVTALLLRLAIKHDLVASESASAHRKSFRALITISSIFGLSIIIALFNPALAMYSWLLLMFAIRLVLKFNKQ